MNQSTHFINRAFNQSIQKPSKKSINPSIGTTKPLHRMLKEVSGYEKEAKDNEAKVQKMRDDEKDPYDIRKQEEVP